MRSQGCPRRASVSFISTSTRRARDGWSTAFLQPLGASLAEQLRGHVTHAAAAEDRRAARGARVLVTCTMQQPLERRCAPPGLFPEFVRNPTTITYFPFGPRGSTVSGRQANVSVNRPLAFLMTALLPPLSSEPG